MAGSSPRQVAGCQATGVAGCKREEWPVWCVFCNLSPFLDVHPPVGGAYRLEVSSPGLERKLSKPEHFANAIGERVKLKVPGQDRLKGILKSANDDSIVIETKHGDEEYPYSQIAKAKTYVAW